MIDNLFCKNGDVGTVRMDVTPEMARNWLENKRGSVKNRNLISSAVEYYSRSMKKGEWKLNGESIKFDNQGNLIDGQNRLAACVKADTSFPTLVVFNLDTGAFDSLDDGAKRTKGQVLKMRGYKHGNELAAAINMLWREENGHSVFAQNERPNNAEIAEYLQRNPGLTKFASVSATTKRLFASVRLPIYLQWNFEQKEPELRESFFHVIEHGGDASSGTPPAVLRERLMSYLVKQEKLRDRYKMAITIKAWNAAREGRKIKQLSWRAEPTEANPEPEDMPKIK